MKKTTSKLGLKITIYFLVSMVALFIINIFYPFSKKTREIKMFTNDANVIRKTDVISGIVKNIHFIERGASYIELKNSRKIILGAARNGIYDTNFLGDFLEVEDSLYKNSKSDTLLIYRKNTNYYFRIGEIINE